MTGSASGECLQICKTMLNIVQYIEIELEIFTNSNANVAFDVD